MYIYIYIYIHTYTRYNVLMTNTEIIPLCSQLLPCSPGAPSLLRRGPARPALWRADGCPSWPLFGSRGEATADRWQKIGQQLPGARRFRCSEVFRRLRSGDFGRGREKPEPLRYDEEKKFTESATNKWRFPRGWGNPHWSSVWDVPWNKPTSYWVTHPFSWDCPV